MHLQFIKLLVCTPTVDLTADVQWTFILIRPPPANTGCGRETADDKNNNN